MKKGASKIIEDKEEPHGVFSVFEFWAKIRQGRGWPMWDSLKIN